MFMQTLDGLRFDPPEGFMLEESVHSLRIVADVPIRANLVVRRQKTQPHVTVEEAGGQMCAELAKTVPNLDDLETAAFKFADGQKGIVIAYKYAVRGSTMLRQYHALRLDDGTLTTLTLTADDAKTGTAERDRYFRALASATTKAA